MPRDLANKPVAPALRALARLAAAALAAGAITAASAPAAALDCATLPTPVYVFGSSAVKATLAEIAKILALQNPPTTLIYKSLGSCAGVDAVLTGTPIMGAGTAAASYWGDGVNELKCDLDAAGTVADVGISDVFAETCFDLPNGLPTNVGDFLGPVQAMTFIVPKTSSQQSISAEAAYFAYGFGASSGVMPWTDPAFLFQRDVSSGTEAMIAKAINVPPPKWVGTATTSSSDILSKVAGSASPEDTLGILSADLADENRATVTVLAYQHIDQDCGYWPDSDAQSFDKRNVRDGHYAIWGPLHLISKLDAQGYPISVPARPFINYMTGTQAPAGLDLITFEAEHHIIPQCAMRVKRTDELGALASFAPPKSCGCFYEKAASGGTDCTPCTSPADCSVDTPACNFGYCEAQ